MKSPKKSEKLSKNSKRKTTQTKATENRALSNNRPGNIRKLVQIMRELRSEKGCPWDREQTYKSLKPFVIEECAELLDAVDNNDIDNIREELGDILLHVIFYSVIAEEKNDFSIQDVIDGISAKLIRRHPHVFADSKAENSRHVIEIWQEIKKKEKKNLTQSRFDGIPKHFPALFRAEEVQKCAAKVGFDWENPQQIFTKIGEEVNELKNALAENNREKIEEEIGDLIFSAVNLSRFLKVRSAEELLASTTCKFIKRFKFIETKLIEKQSSPEKASLEEMDKYWNEAKKNEDI